MSNPERTPTLLGNVFRFLRETWELWYWALFCPSKLQRRMNAWAPAEEEDGRIPDTSFGAILFVRANPRFLKQYLLVVLCLSLPLVGLVFSSGKTVHWLLVPKTLLVTYGTSLLLISLGLHWPLLVALIYWMQPTLYAKFFSEFLTTFASIWLVIQNWLTTFTRTLLVAQNWLKFLILTGLLIGLVFFTYP